MATAWPQKRRVIGTKVQRLDGPAKSTGKAKYSFDISLPGMLQGVMLRCPHAHATITALDTAAGEKLPGVKAIFVVAKAGTELFYVGDEVKELQPGDLYLIPANVRHKVVPVGGPGKAIDVFYPIRDEYR